MIFVILLRLPCTFRGVFSLTHVALLGFAADTPNPYQIKAYKTGYLNMPLTFHEKEFLRFSAKSEYEGLDRLLKAPAQREF